MKDAYSFDTDDNAADESYRKMYDAYVRIFRRCGLTALPVEADTGDMGGSSSHEFMIPCDAGEDAILESEDGAYAANLERAEGFCDLSRVFPGADAALETVPTPNVGSIVAVAALLGAEARQLVKTLIYRGADSKVVAVLCPGDREVNEIKLRKLLPGAELADPATIREVTGAEVGFAGPVGLTIPLLADRGLQGLRGGIIGANQTDAHRVHFDLERDSEIRNFHDLCFPKPGDLAPDRKTRLRERRGVEVGHVFKLGTKYSEAMGASFLDEQGRSHPMIMGCYGIGVSRTLQAVIEQSHDKNGIIWPVSLAPFEVVISLLSPRDPAALEVAESLQQTLAAAGVEVLLDDREERPGFKFKDADLIGFPLRVTVGGRGLEKGEVEIKARTDTDFAAVPVAEAAEAALKRLRALREAV